MMVLNIEIRVVSFLFRLGWVMYADWRSWSDWIFLLPLLLFNKDHLLEDFLSIDSLLLLFLLQVNLAANLSPKFDFFKIFLNVYVLHLLFKFYAVFNSKFCLNRHVSPICCFVEVFNISIFQFSLLYAAFKCLFLSQFKCLLLLLDGFWDNTTCRLLYKIRVKPCLSIVKRITVE